MVIEAIRKLVGKTETQTTLRQKERELPPPSERKYALMYLVYKLGSITREQIENMANEIYEATKNGKYHSLAEICKRAGVNVPNLDNDPFLNHVSLVYSTAEMEKQFRPTPIQEGEEPRSLADALAGYGPARPLLKELYSLDSSCLVTEKDNGIFKIEHRGASFADAIEYLYKNRDWRSDFIIYCGKYKRSLTPNVDIPQL